MMAAEGAIYPVYKLMRENGQSFRQDGFLSAVTGYYSLKAAICCRCRLTAPPQCFTTTRIVRESRYRQGTNHLERNGRCVPEAFRQRCFVWFYHSLAVLDSAGKLQCPPRSSICIRSERFWWREHPLQLNGEHQVAHIQHLSDWHKSGIFSYGGRRSDAAPKFYSQECGMYMDSSAGYAG